MNDQNSQAIGIRLSPEDRQKIEELAKSRNISISELVRKWISGEHEQKVILDELKDLKTFTRIGFNKNFYMILRVLHGNDNQKIEEEYNEYKLT